MQPISAGRRANWVSDVLDPEPERHLRHDHTPVPWPDRRRHIGEGNLIQTYDGGAR